MQRNAFNIPSAFLCIGFVVGSSKNKKNEASKHDKVVTAEDKEDVEKRLVQTLKMGFDYEAHKDEVAACGALPKSSSRNLRKVPFPLTPVLALNHGISV